MKSVFKTLMIAVLAIVALQSCKSSQNMVQGTQSLQGEWNIIELNGSSLVPAEHQPFPYIGFNVSNKSIYGTSGCNRIMGSYQSLKPGKLSFGQMGMTMMMCPDMDIENRVTKMMEQVKSYKLLSNNQLAFYGKGSKPIAVLNKRELKEDIVKLDGTWVIQELNDQELEEGVNLTLDIDVAKKHVSGQAGCNRLMGGFEVVDGVTHSITFPNLAVTRMFCDRMELENQVLKAYGEVYSYDLLPSGVYLYFYSQDGKTLMKLVKEDFLKEEKAK